MKNIREKETINHHQKNKSIIPKYVEDVMNGEIKGSDIPAENVTKNQNQEWQK